MSVPTRLKQDDEVRILCHLFSEMTTRFKSSFDPIHSKGFLVADSHGRPFEMSDFISQLQDIAKKSREASVQFCDPRLPKFRDCDMSSVKRLEISNSIEVREKTTRTTSDSIRRHFVPEGRGWDVLKAIYNAMGKRPPTMGATNEHAFDKIDVDVIISARRPTIADGNQADALERIANAFKDVENPPIKAVFKDGRKLSLSDYRVTRQFSIASENKIPIAKDVCDLLDAWLREQIQNIETATM